MVPKKSAQVKKNKNKTLLHGLKQHKHSICSSMLKTLPTVSVRNKPTDCLHCGPDRQSPAGGWRQSSMYSLYWCKLNSHIHTHTHATTSNDHMVFSDFFSGSFKQQLLPAFIIINEGSIQDGIDAL